MAFEQYLDALVALVTRIRDEQSSQIRQAARLVADTLAADGLVHTSGTGHSHVLAEDAWTHARWTKPFRPRGTIERTPPWTLCIHISDPGFHCSMGFAISTRALSLRSTTSSSCRPGRRRRLSPTPRAGRCSPIACRYVWCSGRIAPSITNRMVVASLVAMNHPEA